MRTPLIACEQWIAFPIWTAISDECIYSSFITHKTVGFVRLCDKKLVSAHTEEHRGTTAGGGTPEVPCPGYFQAHYRRAISPLMAHLPTEEAQGHSTSRAPQ